MVRVSYGPRDALNGDVETQEEGRVSVGMATRRVDPTEGVLGDLPGRRVVVECECNAGFDAIENGPSGSRRRKGTGEKCSLTGARLDVSRYAANS